MEKMDTVQLLRHYRHDYLNKIQLIKGYLSLGKLDKVNEVLEDIVKLSENETNLSNLNMPLLAELFLTYNWQVSSVKLKYDVIKNGNSLHLNDEFVVQWFERFFEKIENAAQNFNDNELYIRIKLDNQELSFFIEYNGILEHTESIEQFLELQSSKVYISNLIFNPQSFSFHVSFEG